MLELLSGAHTRVPMQVSIALLRESLAAPLTLVRPRLGVCPCMVHCARLNWELPFANGAGQAKVKPSGLRVHNVASL